MLRKYSEEKQMCVYVGVCVLCETLLQLRLWRNSQDIFEPERLTEWVPVGASRRWHSEGLTSLPNRSGDGEAAEAK